MWGVFFTITYARDLSHKLGHPTYSQLYRLEEANHHSYTLTDSDWSREFIHHTQIQCQTLLVCLNRNTNRVQGRHEECQKRLDFLMAAWAKGAHFNIPLPSATELQ